GGDGHPAGAIVAVDERDRLPVVAQVVARIHIDQRQLRRIVVQLQRYGEDIRPARGIDRHLEGTARLGCGGRRGERQRDRRCIGRRRLLLQCLLSSLLHPLWLASRGRLLLIWRQFGAWLSSRRLYRGGRNANGTDAPQRDAGARAGVDLLQIQRAQILTANHMRNQQEHDLILRGLLVVVAEEVLEQRNLRQSGDAGEVVLGALLQQSSEDAGLAFSQANRLVHGALAEDRLVEAAQVDGAALLRDGHLQLQRHVAVEVDGGRDLDLDADILVLELCVDQRADDRGGCAGLIGTGGDWNL